MDKIRLDFFDILGYLIPGTALLLALWVAADKELVALDGLYAFVLKIKAEILLSGVVIAYIMGFTLHFFGSLINWFFGLFHLPGKLGKWWRWAMSYRPRKITADEMPAKWVIIREFGERHMAILDRWQALKALSSNLATFSLIAAALCIVKSGNTCNAEWARLTPAFFALFLIYTKQANIFRTYLDDDSVALLQYLQFRNNK